MKRLEALLNDPAAGDTYRALSKTRGEFTHGRKIEGTVPSEKPAAPITGATAAMAGLSIWEVL